MTLNRFFKIVLSLDLIVLTVFYSMAPSGIRSSQMIGVLAIIGITILIILFLGFHLTKYIAAKFNGELDAMPENQKIWILAVILSILFIALAIWTRNGALGFIACMIALPIPIFGFHAIGFIIADIFKFKSFQDH